MNEHLPIHDKLDTALETIRACIRELDGFYAVVIDNDAVTIKEYNTDGTVTQTPCTNAAQFVNFMNEHAVPAE